MFIFNSLFFYLFKTKINIKQIFVHVVYLDYALIFYFIQSGIWHDKNRKTDNCSKHLCSTVKKDQRWSSKKCLFGWRLCSPIGLQIYHRYSIKINTAKLLATYFLTLLHLIPSWLVKFIHSEKATNFCEISTLDLS